MVEHTEHVTIDAWSADCIEGECDHIDEDGMPDDLSACPSFAMEVCVGCQVERGLTSDPAWWEGALSPWPHEPEDREPTPPLVLHGPEVEPPIFKPSPYSDGPVHWAGETGAGPTSLHGNGAKSFARTSGDEDEVTCKLCLTLLVRESVERGPRDG